MPAFDWTPVHPAIRWVRIGWWDAQGVREALLHRPKQHLPQTEHEAQSPSAPDIEQWKRAALLKDRTRQEMRSRLRAGDTVASIADDWGVPVEFVKGVCAWQLFGDADA